MILLLVPKLPAQAYTAAGDRIFPATILLPQIGPSDEFYITGSTLPQTSLPGSDGGRNSNISLTFDKTITDKLSLTMTAAYSIVNDGSGQTNYGWQDFDAALQYLVYNNPEHEFLLSAGVDQNFGGTGARGVGAYAQSATTPSIYFGKGFGDIGVGLLRPFAISGYGGSQIADRGPRPNAFQSGVLVEYSLPYFDSKVSGLAMPDVLRSTTLICEFAFTNPTGHAEAGKSTVLIGPGFNYAGQGWDIGLEALIPATRTTGTGLGVIAQLHLSLDYLSPNGIGRPLF